MAKEGPHRKCLGTGRKITRIIEVINFELLKTILKDALNVFKKAMLIKKATKKMHLD